MANVERDLLANTEFLLTAIQAQEDLQLLSNPATGRYAGIVSFRHQQCDSGDLFKALKKHNVVCAQRGAGIRFSPHFYTQRSDIEKAVQLAASGCQGT